jgi:hypothetical protein
LRRRIAVNWATLTGADHRISEPSDSPEFNRIEKTVIGPSGPDFTQTPAGADGGAPDSATTEPKPISDVEAGPGRRLKALRPEEITSGAYEFRAPAIYPARWKSRLLCIKNLGLPFRNRKFAVLVGVIYFIFAWAWASSDPRQSPVMQKLAADVAVQAEQAHLVYINIQREIEDLEKQKKELEQHAAPGAPPGPEMVTLTDQLQRAKASEEPARKTYGELYNRSLAVDGGRKAQLNEQIRQLESQPSLTSRERFLFMLAFFGDYSPLEEVLNPQALLSACEQGPLLSFLLLGLWAGLVSYVEMASRWPFALGKAVIGTAHFTAHLVALLFISWLASGFSVPIATLLKHHLADPWPDVLRIAWNFLVTLILGGMLGGFIMGVYWTLTSTLFNMHTGDAFGALGLPHYKHFLRIKLEPNRATIYPIALDKVPGRNGWRWKLKSGEVRPPHNPQIMPVRPLEPRLIEPPVVILAETVQR